ncbi:MAG: LLM class flavin-dependent oxidoreductase [Vicinamibacterales bacterium]
MTSRFQLGFMLRIPLADDGGCDVVRHYQDALELAVTAEQLGFDSLWVTQHHFGSVDSSLPSPLIFLAAVAARTRRIRLGTTVITASLEHPIRLAEDAATLDVLSGGRVELGLGTSSNEVEHAAFWIPAEQQREFLHRTALDLANAFEGRPCSGVPGAVVQPRTPGLAERMWMATSKDSHAAFAATHGFGLITNYRPADLDKANQGYLETYRGEMCRTGATPRIGMSRGLFPTTDKAAARRTLAPHAARFVERGRRFGWLSPGFTVDDYFAREDFHYGHPDEVAESLDADPGLPYATELLTGMLSARLTPRELIPVMERIATDVAPALGWAPREAC